MDVLTSFVDGIKSDRLGHVKGYLVRFGDSKATDLEGDYFTKATDYGFPLEEGKRVPLNVYYHHGMDSQVGKKSIGSGFIKMDAEGLWYEAQLDMADEYGKMIAKLCKQGKMGFSSGAAAHMVERKSMGGASEIIRWPIAEASITPTPAEFRNSIKSLEEYYGMGEVDMEEEEMVMAPMAEQSAAEYAAEIFKEAEGELIHEGLEAYWDALSGAIEVIESQDMADALIDAFAERAKGLYAMHGAKCIQPASLRGVERRLRDADQPSEQPDLVVEAKAHDKDERQELLARLELLTQL